MAGGYIDYNGVKPNNNEQKSLEVLVRFGCRVSLIPRSRIDGVKTPDMMIGIESWELKCPIGGSKYTIANNIQDALRQSRNVILDIRNMKRPQNKARHEAINEFNKNKTIKKLIIIASDGLERFLK